MNIIIATGNAGKAKEIATILQANGDPRFTYSPLPTSNIAEPDEPYATFMENARHKAKYYAQACNSAALSEDAGLCINALDGFPGVWTKDFVIESGSLSNAFLQLQNKLSSNNDYSAAFICAAALYIPELDQFIQFEGIEPGTLSFPARGNSGFGLDPIFIPQGYNNTLAELGPEVKNKIGHRAIAMLGIATQLKQLQIS